MAGRMNWDRVRMENRAHRQGAEWIQPEDKGSGSDGRWHNSVREAGKTPIPGCSCGKKVGFKGDHKAGCKLRKRVLIRHRPPAAAPRPKFVSMPKPESELATLFRKVGLGDDLRGFLSAVLLRLKSKGSSFEVNRARRTVEAMLAQIDRLD